VSVTVADRSIAIHRGAVSHDILNFSVRVLGRVNSAVDDATELAQIPSHRLRPTRRKALAGALRCARRSLKSWFSWLERLRASVEKTEAVCSCPYCAQVIATYASVGTNTDRLKNPRDAVLIDDSHRKTTLF
jgi:hypothetical protein